jgi:cation diffusion facilitator family transporter
MHRELIAERVRVEAQARTAMRISLAVGILMLVAKLFAYFATGSAAILSDAAESVVHNVAVMFAVYSLRLSLKPPDKDHMYGHDRISFFSAGFEGVMIVVAAMYIAYEAVVKWIGGLRLENIDSGIWIIGAATVINAGLGWWLVVKGKKLNLLILEANGKHVLTDSWTSLGVIFGLFLVKLTGWLPFDPIIAIVVASNILFTGYKLVRRSVGGLMDETDPESDKRLRAILDRETQRCGISYHHLRHRNAGNRLMVEFHLQFNDDVPIAQAHETATAIEKELLAALPYQTEVLSHLEPLHGHDEVHEKLLRGTGEAPLAASAPPMK